MFHDPRIDAGINLDGGMEHGQGVLETSLYLPGQSVQRGLDRPFLLFGQPGHDHLTLEPESSDLSWPDFWSNQRGPKLDISLLQARHGSFSDLQILVAQADEAFDLPAEAVEDLIGTIDPDRSIAAQRAYIGAFLDLHVGAPRRTPTCSTGPHRPFPRSSSSPDTTPAPQRAPNGQSARRFGTPNHAPETPGYRLFGCASRVSGHADPHASWWFATHNMRPPGSAGSGSGTSEPAADELARNCRREVRKAGITTANEPQLACGGDPPVLMARWRLGCRAPIGDRVVPVYGHRGQFAPVVTGARPDGWGRRPSDRASERRHRRGGRHAQCGNEARVTATSWSSTGRRPPCVRRARSSGRFWPRFGRRSSNHGSAWASIPANATTTRVTTSVWWSIRQRVSTRLPTAAQIVTSHVVAILAQDLADIRLRPLGSYRVHDFAQPELLHQVKAPGLPRAFPALETLENAVPPVTAITSLDMCGASTHATALGPGGIGEAQARFMRFLRDRFEIGGGRFIKLVGDGVHGLV